MRSKHSWARAVAAASLVQVAAYLLWRPRMLRWGATDREVAERLPGDDLIHGPDGAVTMATNLPAPPEQVWPWLVQMGGDRGGWYAWDLLDNDGQPSAQHIVPEWQSLEVGQRLRAAPGPGTQAPNWFTVAIADPNRTLVLQSSYALPSGRGFDPRSGPMPKAYVQGIWGFHLRPTPDGGTRLVVRNCARTRPRVFTGPLSMLLFEPTHFIMQTRQFHNLRERVGAGSKELSDRAARGVALEQSAVGMQEHDVAAG
jgi:hypothetical protein